MTSVLKVTTLQNLNSTTIITQTNSTTVTLGVSGQTISVPSGATLAISGTVTGITSILTGSIIMYGSGSIPTGYLECNAQAVSRSTYADLFAVIGTTYGAGDGSTTFLVPDLRDNFPVGKSGTKSLATKAGSNTATLATTNLASHNHLVSNYLGKAAGNGSDGSIDINYVAGASNTGGVITASSSQNTGSGTAFNTFPPYIALTFIIKT